MFYPGQAVYVPSEKRLGIYLALEPDERYPYTMHNLYVYIFEGEKGDQSSTYIHETKDLIAVTKPDKKSATKQLNYKTPFQRDSFLHIYSDKEAEAMRDELVLELNKIANSKWFKDNYQLDITVRGPISDNGDEEDGKGTN